MIYCQRTSQVVLVLVVAYAMKTLAAKSPQTLQDLKSDLLKFSSLDTSSSSSSDVDNTKVNEYMEQRLRQLVAQDPQQSSVTLDEQHFNTPTGTGVNYILTLHSDNYGTKDDVLYILASHYRTSSGNVTLAREGSGVVASLRIIQALLDLRTSGCKFSNTVVFVCFDFSPDTQTIDNTVTSGSKEFLDRQLPNLLQNGATVGGVYILGTLLTYNPLPKTQEMPSGFALLPIPLVKELVIHENKGDFILAVSRSKEMLSLTKRQWNTTTAWDSCEIADKTAEMKDLPLTSIPGLGTIFSLYLMPLLFSGPEGTLLPLVMNNLKDYPWLINGDQVPFWYHPTKPPTLFLTDTANLRKGECYSNRCPGETLLTDDNLRFFLRNTRAVTDLIVSEITSENKCETTPLTCSANYMPKLNVMMLFGITSLVLKLQ